MVCCLSRQSKWKIRHITSARWKLEFMAVQVIKYVVGWRFAPACCAAQSVRRARPLAALSVALTSTCRASGSKAKLFSNTCASASTSIPLQPHVPAERVQPVHFHLSFVALFRSARFGAAQKAPPNHSLNRTHCGRPPIGLISLWPIGTLPQCAG